MKKKRRTRAWLAVWNKSGEILAMRPVRPPKDQVGCGIGTVGVSNAPKVKIEKNLRRGNDK